MFVVKLLIRENVQLSPISWDEIGEKVWVPHWREIQQARAAAFTGVSLTTLPQVAREPMGLDRLFPGQIAVLSPEAQRRQALRALTIWLSLDLHTRGMKVETQPGGEVRLVNAHASLEPAKIIRDLADNGCSPDEWRAICRQVEPQAS
jgi:hypothetical protein